MNRVSHHGRYSKAESDRHTRLLPPLVVGDLVAILYSKENKWSIYGTIVESTRDRECVLMCDEMAIQAKFEHDGSLQQVLGYPTIALAPSTAIDIKKDELATNILVFMLAGVAPAAEAASASNTLTPPMLNLDPTFDDWIGGKVKGYRIFAFSAFLDIRNSSTPFIRVLGAAPTNYAPFVSDILCDVFQEDGQLLKTVRIWSRPQLEPRLKEF
eukprot:TCALIF_12008-PA protein Name:"Protein of unknown function" AED:0.78 eAED:0.78 QI:0/0/0/0.25/1/1/4/0/212